MNTIESVSVETLLDAPVKVKRSILHRKVLDWKKWRANLSVSERFVLDVALALLSVALLVFPIVDRFAPADLFTQLFLK